MRSSNKSSPIAKDEDDQNILGGCLASGPYEIQIKVYFTNSFFFHRDCSRVCT